MADNEGVSARIDRRPVFTIVMGCDGAGKTAWKRHNYDRLPRRYFDLHSLAGGLGDWNGPDARERAGACIAAQISESIQKGRDFGTESTYSGKPGPALVERVVAEGYRVEGVYLGTNDPQINIARIENRVLLNTGHRVDPERIPERWKHSLANLRRTAGRFESLQLLDNSSHDSLRRPRPVEQCRLERGAVVSQSVELASWCEEWLAAAPQGQGSLRPPQVRATPSRVL